MRSGSWPRRLDEEEDTPIGHVLVDGHFLTPFARSIAETDPEATKVVGALVDDETPPTPTKQAATTAPMPVRPGVLVEDTEKDEWDSLEGLVGERLRRSPDLLHAGLSPLALCPAAREGARVQHLQGLRTREVVGAKAQAPDKKEAAR